MKVLLIVALLVLVTVASLPQSVDACAQHGGQYFCSDADLLLASRLLTDPVFRFFSRSAADVLWSTQQGAT